MCDTHPKRIIKPRIRQQTPIKTENDTHPTEDDNTTVVEEESSIRSIHIKPENPKSSESYPKRIIKPRLPLHQQPPIKIENDTHTTEADNPTEDDKTTVVEEESSHPKKKTFHKKRK